MLASFIPYSLPGPSWNLLGRPPDCLLGLSLHCLGLALNSLRRALHCLLCLLGGWTHNYPWSILHGQSSLRSGFVAECGKSTYFHQEPHTRLNSLWREILDMSKQQVLDLLKNQPKSKGSLSLSARRVNALERRACRLWSSAASPQEVKIATPYLGLVVEFFEEKCSMATFFSRIGSPVSHQHVLAMSLPQAAQHGTARQDLSIKYCRVSAIDLRLQLSTHCSRIWWVLMWVSNSNMTSVIASDLRQQ